MQLWDLLSSQLYQVIVCVWTQANWSSAVCSLNLLSYSINPLMCSSYRALSSPSRHLLHFCICLVYMWVSRQCTSWLPILANLLLCIPFYANSLYYFDTGSVCAKNCSRVYKDGWSTFLQFCDVDWHVSLTTTTTTTYGNVWLGCCCHGNHSCVMYTRTDKTTV